MFELATECVRKQMKGEGQDLTRNTPSGHDSIVHGISADVDSLLEILDAKGDERDLRQSYVRGLIEAYSGLLESLAFADEPMILAYLVETQKLLLMISLQWDLPLSDAFAEDHQQHLSQEVTGFGADFAAVLQKYRGRPKTIQPSVEGRILED